MTSNIDEESFQGLVNYTVTSLGSSYDWLAGYHFGLIDKSYGLFVSSPMWECFKEYSQLMEWECRDV